MPTLLIGTRRFHADEPRVQRAAQRMFRLSEPQRRYKIAAAKTRLARAGDAERADPDNPALADAAAVILSQGIKEI